MVQHEVNSNLIVMNAVDQPTYWHFSCSSMTWNHVHSFSFKLNLHKGYSMCIAWVNKSFSQVFHFNWTLNIIMISEFIPMWKNKPNRFASESCFWITIWQNGFPARHWMRFGFYRQEINATNHQFDCHQNRRIIVHFNYLVHCLLICECFVISEWRSLTHTFKDMNELNIDVWCGKGSRNHQNCDHIDLVCTINCILCGA